MGNGFTGLGHCGSAPYKPYKEHATERPGKCSKTSAKFSIFVLNFKNYIIFALAISFF